VDATNHCQGLVAAAQPTIWNMRMRSYNAYGNSNFECDQRNLGASFIIKAGATTYWGADRWWWVINAATMAIFTQNQALNPVIPGTNYRISNRALACSVSTAQPTLAATDYILLYHYVEGPRMRELISDVHSISLLAQCSVPLKFSVGLCSSDGSYSIVYLCTIPTPNVWTLITIPSIPVWTSSFNFPLTPGSSGYVLRICLAAGSTYVAPSAGSWVNANVLAAPGQDNFGSFPAGTAFYLGFAQHEPGPVCTQFIDLPFEDNLRACQRYFSKNIDYSVKAPGNNYYRQVGWFTASNYGRAFAEFPVEMAKPPTLTNWDHAGTLNNVYLDQVGPVGGTLAGNSTRGIQSINFNASYSVAGGEAVLAQWTAATGW
jgi:hypothetical protein